MIEEEKGIKNFLLQPMIRIDALSKHMQDIPPARDRTSGPSKRPGIVAETTKIVQEKICEGVQKLTTQFATHSTSTLG